jgi:drug/metabolite transporter (DMT)-like permease
VAEANPAQSPRYPVSGWVEAALFVLALSVLGIVYVVGQRIGANPVALVLYGTTVSALALLAVTGLGPDARRIAFAPQSWLVGIGSVAIEIAYYALLAHVSPALGSLLMRFAIPLSFVIGWMLFGRRPQRLAIVGSGVVLAALVPLLAMIEPELRSGTAIALMAGIATSNLRNFAAEFHPWNRSATTVREKMRVTGLVVLVTSVASLGLASGLALLVATGRLPPVPMLPTAADMLHGPTILLGAVVVAAVLTAMAVLSFSSVVKITSENFVAMTAFIPAVTLLVQIAASAVGLIPAYTLDPSLLPGMGIVIAGVLLILYAARK